MAKDQKSPLEKLFGSPAKVKVLQIFLASPNAYFSPEDVAKRTGMSTRLAERNIGVLTKIGVLQMKQNGKKKSKKATKK